MVLQLSQFEKAELFKQNPATMSDGGWQSLLIKLQTQTNRHTGRIYLTLKDLERIRRYAFDYGNGGWENRLTAIFARSLGQNLSGQNINSTTRILIDA
ncbi:MAG: aspartyl-tRNA synthetase [Candidatus Wallbacteria bacterium HGW-Wallbacteria-1]|jgi:hypothetical protein|uniref:Aspartyl-tRNA synthetase n=1 Tax=Candidatus Wallbacteria bacterium HGW-Wallbacteria-1 TaxID=2013854 RepID=A0A2N1PIQ1_9BACT|nr:MAG: aspartyl-tRNA synthetase [Candidatus Wallbacteria bacterium HGW-Wallbacteria-1]